MTTPARIVSLLPSSTEILCALGLRDHLVGVSHECDYPSEVIGLPALRIRGLFLGVTTLAFALAAGNWIFTNVASGQWFGFAPWIS